MSRVCVFEDRDKNYDALYESLRKLLDEEFKVERYDGSREVPAVTGDEAVREFLLDYAPAILAVIDWDLSEFKQGVRRAAIRAVAEELSVPIIMYQGDDPHENATARLRRWQERRIVIPGKSPPEAVAEKCADVARGFLRIHLALDATTDGPRLLETLRSVLEPPSGAPLHLEQFAVGNQELLRLPADRERGLRDPESIRFIATWMGYLIHNRILQFPGPVLGNVAAAAYLAVSLDELRTEDVAAVLEPARYRGPFSGSLPGWWRSKLDVIITDAMEDEDATIPLGLEALKRRLKRDVVGGTCREGHVLDEPGYVCILTDSAVCHEHSAPEDAWIPQGADRCRIHAEELELLQAWLGL